MRACRFKLGGLARNRQALAAPNPDRQVFGSATNIHMLNIRHGSILEDSHMLRDGQSKSCEQAQKTQAQTQAIISQVDTGAR